MILDLFTALGMAICFAFAVRMALSGWPDPSLRSWDQEDRSTARRERVLPTSPVRGAPTNNSFGEVGDMPGEICWVTGNKKCNCSCEACSQ